jgi:dUTP pyrophosphatase
MFGKRVKIWSSYNGYVDPKLILDKQELEFVNMSPNKDPYYEYEGDSGFDLRAWITKDEDGAKIDKEDNKHFITLKPLERRMIHTGLYFKLPAFTEIQVRPRSGCSIKEGLTLINCVGTVDECYRGEVCVLAINLSDKKLTIKSGERIAQGVLCPVYNSYLVNLKRVDNIINNTERGNNGYGSTGKK